MNHENTSTQDDELPDTQPYPENFVEEEFLTEFMADYDFLPPTLRNDF